MSNQQAFPGGGKKQLFYAGVNKLTPTQKGGKEGHSQQNSREQQRKSKSKADNKASSEDSSTILQVPDYPPSRCDRDHFIKDSIQRSLLTAARLVVQVLASQETPTESSAPNLLQVPSIEPELLGSEFSAQFTSPNGLISGGEWQHSSGQFRLSDWKGLQSLQHFWRDDRTRIR